MIVLTHSGPLSITLRLAESDDGWRFGLDTRGRDGCGIGSALSCSPAHLTRASAIASAVRWIRAEHRDLSQSVSAWMEGLVGDQSDMFGEVR